jgi:hypothetical protein
MKVRFLFLFLVFSSSIAFSQEFNDAFRGEKGIRAMFYNCENLFDTEHDTLKNDQDFMPDGNYRWSKYRYWEKLQRVSKVITSVGGWEAPELVGLVEIENTHVLINLTKGSS